MGCGDSQVTIYIVRRAGLFMRRPPWEREDMKKNCNTKSRIGTAPWLRKMMQREPHQVPKKK